MLEKIQYVIIASSDDNTLTNDTQIYFKLDILDLKPTLWHLTSF